MNRGRHWLENYNESQYLKLLKRLAYIELSLIGRKTPRYTNINIYYLVRSPAFAKVLPFFGHATLW